MTLHTGIGARPGVALAAAARLRVEFGVASFAPERLRRVAARLRAFGAEAPEPEQIILVADALPPGFTGAMPGLEIVGLALGSDTPPMSPLDCPTVIGLGPDFSESVLEDDIVIVDGSRGRVYVSPDAVTMARCQMPAVRARRIFLDESHLAARTASEGQPVAVYAPARTLEEVDAAMENGADGVCFLADEDFPPTASAQAELLGAVLRSLGGLPLLLHVPPERVALSALAGASALGALHLVTNSESEREWVAGRLAATEALMEDEDLPFGTPQFELRLETHADADLPADLDGFTGVFVAEAVGAARMECLLPLAALAHRTRRPLLLALGADWVADLPLALTLNAARLLTPAPTVCDVKDAIREW